MVPAFPLQRDAGVPRSRNHPRFPGVQGLATIRLPVAGLTGRTRGPPARLIGEAVLVIGCMALPPGRARP